MAERRAALRAAVLAGLALFAAPLFATTYGDIDVVPRQGFAPGRRGYYHEYRFTIANRSSRPRQVRIQLKSAFLRGASDSATRTFQSPPRSESLVEVPLLLTGYFAPDQAVVFIDGTEQSDRIRLNQQLSWEEGSSPDVLLSRSVADRESNVIDFERALVGPEQWSASWLQYGRYAGIVVTPADWLDLPPAVQTAILRWTFAGGTLVFTNHPEWLPGSPGTGGEYGLGSIVVVYAPDGVLDDAAILPYLRVRTHDDTIFNAAANELPLLDRNMLPVRGLFGVLLVFAIVAGPVNLILLARRNRRHWIFATIPLLAVVTSLILVGTTVASEGWVRIHRARALTVLDEPRGLAATFGWSGFYATVSPRGEVRFDSDTELRPNLNRETGDADTQWDDGQRLFGSWIGTRVPAYFAVRRSGPRRERLPLRREGTQLAGVNGLGGPIERLLVADASGAIFEARDIAPGQSFRLARTQKTTQRDGGATDIRTIAGADAWSGLLSSLEGEPERVLRGGDYVAILRDTPFLEAPLEKASESTRRGIVYGIRAAVEGASDAR